MSNDKQICRLKGISNVHYVNVYIAITVLCDEFPENHFTKSMLKSQSFFAKSASRPCGLGLARLLSEKYSPVTPFTCGCSAT